MSAVKVWVRRLLSPVGTIDRVRYAVIAFVAFAVKHNVDRTIARQLNGVEWTAANYWLPFGIPVRLTSLDLRGYEFLAVLVAISLPFAWIGVVTTLKRLRTVGWPLWLVLLFFVPVANVLLFALLCAVPDVADAPSGVVESRTPAWFFARLIPADRFGSIAMSIVATAIAGFLLILLGTLALGEYGWGVFVAIPFCQGALAALFIGAHRRVTVTECMGAAIGSVSLSALLLLALAFEGAVCVAIALPLAAGFACVGAAIGYTLQKGPRAGAGALNVVLILVFCAPFTMAASALAPEQPPLLEVSSAVEIDAPADVVWKNVIAFPDLPPPREPLFRLGIAYPERARIVGRGVGAMRFCEFSTGSFVEPITVWDEPRLLRFNVIASPAAMRELSFYPIVVTPHLTGYFQAQTGEFRLVPLGPGRTRLIGTTRYTDRLWPQMYFQLFSDPIVHAIHDRVLNHIKEISERS